MWLGPTLKIGIAELGPARRKLQASLRLQREHDPSEYHEPGAQDLEPQSDSRHHHGERCSLHAHGTAKPFEC